MDGLLAKYIALATHGTVWLRNQSTAMPDLRGSNGPFADVGEVSFGGVNGVDAWLRSLAESGVERIWLSINQALYFNIGRPHEPLWCRDAAFAEGVNGCAGLPGTTGGSPIPRSKSSTGGCRATCSPP
jgi:hypothetical protein